MIKANELRIGNLLNDREGNLCKVFELGKNSILAPTINKPTTKLPNEHIPLTEEWLLKFGFENKILSSEFSMNDFPFIIYNNEIWTDRDNDDDAICKVDFVHELQNFYFAVKRKELELKLN